MNVSFKSTSLKIANAIRHIDFLDFKINEYSMRNPFYLIYSDSQISINGEKAVDYELWCREDVPTIFSLIVGDVIHNIRTALDHLANDLLEINGHPERDGAFPFSRNISELDLAIKKSKFKFASAEAIELLRQIMPYNEGDEYLKWLHDMDILDKHRLIIVTMGSATGEIGGVGGAKIEVIPAMLLKGWTAKSSFSSGVPAFGEQIPATFNLWFEPISKFGGRQVVPLLRELVDHVGRVCDRFAALYGQSVTAQ